MSRSVVVTGGSSGIGRAVVARCLAAGDRVTALGRDAQALDELVGAMHTGAFDPPRTQVCDVTDEDAVARAFADLGPVDVLVANAGTGESATLAETSLASWERQIAVNATGAFLTARAVLPGMRERDRGAIVVVASTAGRAGAPYTAAYTASKHAAVGLVRAVAAEVAGTGVRANAVCPTFVRTPMTERSVATIVDRTGRTAEDATAALAATAPLGRLLEPEEVAAAVLFLASDEARAINGQTLILDGGGIQT